MSRLDYIQGTRVQLQQAGIERPTKANKSKTSSLLRRVSNYGGGIAMFFLHLLMGTPDRVGALYTFLSDFSKTVKPGEQQW